MTDLSTDLVNNPADNPGPNHATAINPKTDGSVVKKSSMHQNVSAAARPQSALAVRMELDTWRNALTGLCDDFPKDAEDAAKIVRKRIARVSQPPTSAQPSMPTCPKCGTHEISLERTCHNSSCASYAQAVTVHEGWKATPPADEQAQQAVAFVHELSMDAYRPEEIEARATAIAKLAPLEAQQEPKDAVIERLECVLDSTREALAGIIKDAEDTYIAAKASTPIEISIGQFRRLEKAKTRLRASALSPSQQDAKPTPVLLTETGRVFSIDLKNAHTLADFVNNVSADTSPIDALHKCIDRLAEYAQQDADKVDAQPVAWFAFADNNGPISLELYGWDEKACKHAVLTYARAGNWKGTVEGYLLQMGWTLRPVYLAAARFDPATSVGKWLTEFGGLMTDYRRAVESGLDTAIERAHDAIQAHARLRVEVAQAMALDEISDEEIHKLWIEHKPKSGAMGFARALLARFGQGTQPDAPSQGVSDEEIDELAREHSIYVRRGTETIFHNLNTLAKIQSFARALLKCVQPASGEDSAYKALRELVRLKEIKGRMNRRQTITEAEKQDYEHNKPLAWERARSVLVAARAQRGGQS